MRNGKGVEVEMPFNRGLEEMLLVRHVKKG